jgi:peptidyl-prolyl cis-trans isomerase C
MTSHSYRVTALAGLIALCACLPAGAASDKPLVTVNGKAIAQSYADVFVKEQVTKGAEDNQQLRDAVREELIRREALVQAARAKGIDKSAEVKARVEFAQQEVLIGAFIQDHLRKNPITDEKAKAEYEKMKAGMTAREYKARHILVESEADAKAIIAKLDSGTAFADLAKDSKDPGSKDNGGDLGWNQPNAFVKPFAEAMVALEKGKYTKTPVKSDFGYHVILTEDSRTSEPPAFEQIKPQLLQHLQQQEVGKLVAQVREKAKIK